VIKKKKKKKKLQWIRNVSVKFKTIQLKNKRKEKSSGCRFDFKLGSTNRKTDTLNFTKIKNTDSPKWTGSEAQATEHLLCQLEALSSNPSPTKKENKTKIHTGSLVEG
jgi:hypothetical protein